MKWSLFIYVLLFSYSCRNKTVAEKESVAPALPPVASHEENILPTSMYPLDDSGFYDGPVAKPISRFEEFDSTEQEQALANMISRDNIKLLDHETLSHTMYVDPQKEIRYDTMKNKNSMIVSEYYFGKNETQKVKLNGKLIFNTREKNDDDSWEVIYDFNEASFRHFSFYGKAYYYFNVNQIYSFGGSARNVFYHFIFNEKGEQLATWQTCRFWKILIGDVNGDKLLDYIDYNNEDFCTTVPSSDDVTITLWSAGPAGVFVQQKDARGKPWQIDARTGENYDSLLVLRKHWPVPLK